MALPPGRTLGPYRIVSLLGAGGMGEVYRAEDPKLERQVALKVLAPHPGGDPVPLERFEREAKAVAALSHPNILGIFDFGREGALAYAAMELLEGETLRQRLKGGALPPRRAVELALQMAQGLAAAHDKGILHRDLKPENLFITTEGRLKILDFGLATRMPVGFRFQETMPRGGLPNPEGGTFFGTVGYVSPEQAKGEPMDGRSEVFAFGVVLFEMLGGRRPFEKESAPQTLAAIIEEDPPELRPPKGPVPVSLERIVLHCLEKRPELRFQSMRDLAFDLENLSFASEAGREAPRGRAVRKVPWGLAGGILLGAGLVFGAWWLGGRDPEPPTFRRVTFRQGFVRCARFMPDGGGFLYSATWGEDPPRLYSSRMESLEDRPMDLPGAHLQALSPAGEMALQLRVEGPFGWVYRGALARASLGGSAPKEVAEGVEWADWSPDGRLAIVRTVGGEGRLEFPMGEVRARTPGWISHPRFSPDGGAIAFIEHPIPGYSRGLVKVVDLDSGRIRGLSGGYSSAEGLAWRGEEVWFTGAEAGSNRALYAVSPSGRRRLVLRMPGSLHLYDIGPGGRVLLGLEDARTGILWVGEDGVRDLSWRTWSLLRGLSADGRRILFDEEGDSSGPDYDIYLRGTDGSPAMHVGQGSPAALGPDGAWVAAIQHRPSPHLVLLPTGPGEPRHLPAFGIEAYRGNLAFMPDGRRLVFSANEADKGPRVYVQDVEGGALRPLTAEHQTPLLGERFLSPDGRRMLVRDHGDAPLLLDLSAGEATARPVRGMEAGERVLHWDAGGRALYVYRPGPFPAQAWKVEWETGRRSLWRRLDPPGHPGDVLSHSAQATPDGRTLALIYRRQRTVLYEAAGLR